MSRCSNSSVLTANPVSSRRDDLRDSHARSSASINASGMHRRLRVWEQMQDWHIKHLRPLTIYRAGDGRWQMDFIMSVLVLKPEMNDTEVGQPYDR